MEAGESLNTSPAQGGGPDDRTLRPARPADASTLWAWRNLPSTRAASRQDGWVPWRDHVQWFARAISSAERRIFVAELDGRPAGMVRLDRVEPGVWEVSVVVDPSARGRGVAGWAIEAAMAQLDGNAPTRFRAVVGPRNQASLRLFARLGFTDTGAEPGSGFRVMELAG